MLTVCYGYYVHNGQCYLPLAAAWLVCEVAPLGAVALFGSDVPFDTAASFGSSGGAADPFVVTASVWSVVIPSSDSIRLTSSGFSTYSRHHCVCVRACARVCACACACMWLYVCVCMRTCDGLPCVCVCTRAYKCACMRVCCVGIGVSVYTYVCMSVCVNPALGLVQL